jgi:hypothetical protein
VRRLGSPFRLPPRWRWIVWPFLALSGGGATAGVWLQREEISIAECTPLVALPGMAALFYWLNHHIFKAAMPHREDLDRSTHVETITRGDRHK